MRPCHLRAKYLLLLTPQVAAIGCSEEPNDPFAGVVQGQTREQVVELVKEPTEVLGLPFPAEYEGSCSEGANIALIYAAGEREKVLVFLDDNERVLCKMYYKTFIHY